MNLKNLIHIEYLKLFRRSNLLFLFLAIYLFSAPLMRGFDKINQIENVTVDDFFVAMVNSFSIMGLLLLAIFMVNNTGNDFNEGSYKKSRAMGLSPGDYMKGKLLLSGFLIVFVILSTLLLYFIFTSIYLKPGFINIVLGVNFYSLINQMVALVSATGFGLFFIMVFRNRTIGLVFFPFWLITEFILFLIDRSGFLRLYSEFLPGVSAYELYTFTGIDITLLAVVIIYISIFFTGAWYGLTLRGVSR